jgi:predicted metal-dependent peptidase
METRTLSPADMDRIASSRFSALIAAPYLASALTAVTFVAASGLGTVAIDRRLRVYVDPVVLDAWTTQQLAGALIHEVHHVIRGHHDRGSRCTPSPELWNIAGDLEINDDLVRAGIELPPGVLVPERFDLPEHQLAEWYADHLADIAFEA